jgi:MFS superfamily sulfate permease-like transporter
MIHALALLAVILFAAPLVKDLPLAALAGILSSQRIPELRCRFSHSRAIQVRHHGSILHSYGPDSSLPPIVILRLRNMTAIDATGIAALEDLATILHNTHRTMLVCGARGQPDLNPERFVPQLTSRSRPHPI